MEESEIVDNSLTRWIPFLFAEDLVSYCMKSRGIDWKSSFSYKAYRHRLETTFSSDVGKAVNFFPTYFEDHLSEIKTRMIPHFLSDPRNFSNFVYYLADKLFSSDLHLEFLMFCGSVIDVADGLFQTGFPEFLDRTVVAIAFTFDTKLKDSFELCGGWEKLRLYCLEFNNELEDTIERCGSMGAFQLHCLELNKTVEFQKCARQQCKESEKFDQITG